VDSAVPILILSKDRPHYLWAALDNFYRATRYPHSFVLLDMASSDPEVRRVVTGFERRGMFDEVIWSKRNHPDVIWNTIWRISESGAPYVGYLESDVIIEPSDPCWLERLVRLMQRNPRLAMLGAAIDRDDFVDPETARRLERRMPEAQLRALIKFDSPERLQDVSCAAGADIFDPHNPAGRLLLVRADALREVGLVMDHLLHLRLRAAGYQTGTATTVRHRHLSLLNIFDYPHYDTAARNRFVAAAEVAWLPKYRVAKGAVGLDGRDGRPKPSSLTANVAKLRSYFVAGVKRLKWLWNAVAKRSKPPSAYGPHA
jgi:hypothetical protein